MGRAAQAFLPLTTKLRWSFSLPWNLQPTGGNELVFQNVQKQIQILDVFKQQSQF